MPRTKLSRRTVLRGMLASGAAVTVGLPLLDIFCNGNGDALADGSGFPKRFATFFWGNGNIPSRWNPRKDPTSGLWTLAPQTMPLAALKNDIAFVTGLAVKTANSEAHTAGAAGIFTGSSPKIIDTRKTFASASLDQVIARMPGVAVGPRFRSIQTTCDSTLGFTTGAEGPHANGGHSYTGPDAHIEPEFSPHALFNRIFGAGFALPNGSVPTPPSLRLRKSVLDVVLDDAARLRPRLGSADRRRLDAHLDGVRELESQLESQAKTPANLTSCVYPEEPMPDSAFYPIEGRAQMSAYNEAFTKLLTLALACDQTRVVSHWFSASVSRVLYPGSPAEHHSLTHDEADDETETYALPPGSPTATKTITYQVNVDKVVTDIMTELAKMIQSFKDVAEGSETMLDHMVLFATSDCSLGRTHGLSDYPILLAGGCNGTFKMGQHLDLPGSPNVSTVPFALASAFGTIPSWGTEAGEVSSTTPISGIYV